LKSWITLRTCDSSLSNMRAISGALINVFEASRIIARCLVEASFDCFDNRSTAALMRSQPADKHLRRTHRHLLRSHASGFDTKPRGPATFQVKRCERAHWPAPLKRHC
jgi:hypothetical protein